MANNLNFQNAWWNNLGGNSFTTSVQQPTQNYSKWYGITSASPSIASKVWQNRANEVLDRQKQISQTNYNPATAPTPQANNQSVSTVPTANANYNVLRGLVNPQVNQNMPSDQEVVNNYNEWRKNNPNAAGQDWKMELANGVTLTEQNVNNILNPYGAGRPEGVPSYFPDEVTNYQFLRARNPNANEAQLQAIQNRQNSWQPNYLAWLGNYQIGR